MIKNTKKHVSAPYNFIPLNSCVVSITAPPSFDKFHKDKLSGYIELKICTKTPLYIRGTSDDASKFFSPGSIEKIPGSSLRGMIRTLLEIASWGKFEYFDGEKRLYYRGLADVICLRNEYNKQIKNVKAGYLRFDITKRTYFIQPAEILNDSTFIQVEDNREFTIELQTDGKYKICSGKMKGKDKNWLINKPDDNSKQITLDDNDVKDYRNDDNRRIKWNLLEMAKDESGYPNGVPCFYTTYTDLKNNQRIAFGHTRYFRLPYELTIGDHVPDNIKQNDITDIPEAIFGKEGKWASRVFFEDAEVCADQGDIFIAETSPKILASPKPTTFQHYLEQTENATKDTLKHWNNKDALVRGHKFYWHRNTDNDKQYGWIAEKIEINKADFDKFLKFKGINTTDDLINSFDKVKQEGTKYIIGCKFSEIPDGDFKNKLKDYLIASEETKIKAKIKGGQYTVIKAVKPKVFFEGKIRFDNLSKIELGALLFALDLPGNCCHKLGMGKPLGLGSIKLTPKLFVINRGNRYASLFDKGDWHLAIEEKKSYDFISEFERHILSHIPEVDKKGANKLWDTERMKALNIMLDYSNTKQNGWLEKSRYMEIQHPKNKNEFKDRPVLPEPKAFKDQA